MMNIPKFLYDQMIKHALQESPYEACGFLGGYNQDEVSSVLQLENEWKSRIRFYVSEKIVKEALNQLEGKGQKVLALYHSHPSSAPLPSTTDLHNHPDNHIKMVIISLKKNPPNTKCFSITDNSYAEEYPFFIKTV